MNKQYSQGFGDGKGLGSGSDINMQEIKKQILVNKKILSMNQFSAVLLTGLFLAQLTYLTYIFIA